MKKTKKIKKIVSLLAVTVMTFGMFAGCGNVDKTRESADAATTESAPVEPVADPMAKYEEPVTLKSYFEISSTIANIFSEEGLVNSYFTQQQQELTNIYIDYLWYAADTAEDAEQKKNVAIASGEIPDFMLCDKAQLALLAKTDLINKDIYSIYEQYGSDTLKEWLTAEGDDAFLSASFDGVICAIPQIGSAMDLASYLWIRQDWLDAVGMEAPATMEELYNIMVAFSTQDPDKDGQDNTIGMVAHKDFLTAGTGDFVGLFNGFHAYPKSWIENGNGGLEYGSVTPEAKEALAFIAKMYEEDLIEEDFSVKDGAKASEVVASGKAGIQYGLMWNPNWPLNMAIDNDPNADWIAVPVPNVTGKPSTQIELQIENYLVISAECEHPEAVIKLLNYWCYTQTAPNDEYNKYLEPDASGVDTFPLHYAMVRTWNPNKNLEAHLKIKDVLNNGADVSTLNAEEMIYYNDCVKYKNGDMTGTGAWDIFGPEQSAYTVMESYVANDSLVKNKFTGSNTPTMNSKMTIVDDKIMEYYTKVIMGIESLDTWDAFVEEVNGLGLADITSEVNEWYAAR